MDKNVYLVMGLDDFWNKTIFYASLDKSKAKEYTIGLLKECFAEDDKYCMGEITSNKKKIESDEATIRALSSSIAYDGRDETISKLSKRVEKLKKDNDLRYKRLNRDYEKDFSMLCSLKGIHIVEISLDDASNSIGIDDYF